MINPEDLSHPIFSATSLEEFVHHWQALDADYQPEQSNQACRILGAISNNGLARVRCPEKQDDGYIFDIEKDKIMVCLDKSSCGVYIPIPEEIVFLGITKPA